MDIDSTPMAQRTMHHHSAVTSSNRHTGNDLSPNVTSEKKHPIIANTGGAKIVKPVTIRPNGSGAPQSPRSPVIRPHQPQVIKHSPEISSTEQHHSNGVEELNGGTGCLSTNSTSTAADPFRTISKLSSVDSCSLSSSSTSSITNNNNGANCANNWVLICFYFILVLTYNLIYVNRN